MYLSKQYRSWHRLWALICPSYALKAVLIESALLLSFCDFHRLLSEMARASLLEGGSYAGTL